MQTDMSCHLKWYALRVKSNREYITLRGLTGRGYEAFLPRHRRIRADGTVKEEMPLFPGYVFCHFDATNRLPVLVLPGVLHIVGVGKTPVPVDERELQSLRVLVETGLPINTDEAYTVGQQIQVVRGPLAGADGHVVGLLDKRLVVSITLLQRSVSVVLNPDWLTAGAATPLVTRAASACAAA